MKNLQNSFLIRFRSYLLYLIMCSLPLVLVSCSLFTDKKQIFTGENIDNANFIVDQLKGQVVATRVNGLPEEFQISYTACFRDNDRQDNTLPNSLFKIHFFEKFHSLDTSNKQREKDTKTQITDKECSESSAFLFSASPKKSCLQIRTDSSGCLNWTEIYPYHPVNQSVWFRYDRAFEGTGTNKGLKTIPMAVNPWLSVDGSANHLQLVDLRYHSIDKNRKLISLEEKEIPQCRFCSLNGNKVDCQICEQKKRSLSYIISDFGHRTDRPRLWLNELNSNISQEHILIHQEQYSTEHLKTLRQFKVCHSDEKENCDPLGRFFKVRLRIPLQIQVKNYRNEEELLPLTRGDYSVKAYLFLKDETGKHIILHRDMGLISSSLSKVLKETALTSEFYFHVPYEHYGLPAFLGLKIQEEGDFKSFFLPFEGVFSFPNRLRSVIGRNTLTLNQEVLSFYKKNPFKNVSLIDGYHLSGSWLNKAEGFRRAGWDVRLNRMRFSEVSLKNNQCPTPVDRTIRYVGEVCIVDPLTNSVVPNTSIEIQRQDIFFTKDGQSSEGEVINIPKINKNGSLGLDISQFKEGNREYLYGQKQEAYISDTSGCMQWVDNLYHKWYDREKYFVRKMIFSKREWGFEGERMVAINPWHWGFVFFQDITQLGHSSIRTVAKRAERPQIVLHDFRSLFSDPIYTIDRWLGINLFQNLLFLFKVRVDRPDNVASGQGGQRPSAMDVRRGYYFLRFILVKSHTEESGGKGNQVVNNEVYQKQYNKLQSWNINTGWKVGRDGANIGQMMNTNLEYITHFDTYVQIRDAVVNSYINFLFDLDEFIFIGSNNRLIVQLLPTDPKYYSYYDNSCEVDPSQSSFVPFTDHELITRPFMGTFVPGDQRNWNIFRVLSEYVNLELPDTNDIMSLNMTPEQVDQFIKKEKANGLEHKLFTKLQTNLVVQAKVGQWSKKALEVIPNAGSVLEKLYTEINAFVKTESSESLLSDFHQRKNNIIESVDAAVSFISTTLTGPIKGDEKTFFLKFNMLLHDALSVLNSSNNSPEFLKIKMAEINKSFISLVEGLFSVPFSSSQKQLLQERKNNKNRWFKPDISFPNDPVEWSAYNMNLFAKDEGLKVIALGDEPLVNKFLDDLNDIAKIHNEYHIKYLELKKKRQSRYNPLMSIEQRNKDFSTLSEQDHAHLVQDYEREYETFWKNFELINSDNYYAIDTKIKQMYLPDMSELWLNTVLTDGIDSSTLSTPEVMTFLHSLCGFWFDKFYEEYLEQIQLDIIYNKHMDHFQYYKGTLEYFLKSKGPVEQYKDLYHAMQEYNLLPMESSMLLKQNPFRVHSTEMTNSSLLDIIFSSEEERAKVAAKAAAKSAANHTVIQAIYKNKQVVIQEAAQIAGYAAVSHMTFTGSPFFALLNSYRHPYFKCLANPFNFFHIERKIIVGDIGSDYSDLKYEYGVTKSFNVQRSFDYAYSATSSMSRSFSTSLGTGFVALGGLNMIGAGGRFLNPLNVVNPFIAFSGVRLGSEWSTSRSDSDQNRRQASLRIADESLYLQANHSVISIRLKNFRHCLIVRAKNLAFEGYNKDMVWNEELEENFIHQIPYIKSGLMICSEDINADTQQEPFYITEDYFYMYQLKPGDRGQFQNPLSFRNRPFVMSIRGITEMEKFSFLAHAFIEADKEHGVEDYDPFGLYTNPYNVMSQPVEGMRRAIERSKVWDKTGFYPGVYNVKYDNEHYYFRDPNKRDKGMFERFGEWMYKSNPLGNIRFDESEALFQRPKKQ